MRAKEFIQCVAEGRGYTIDQDDYDEFTSDEIERIRDAIFPDTLRDNLRAAKKAAQRKAYLDSLRGPDGGDSSISGPVGTADYD